MNKLQEIKLRKYIQKEIKNIVSEAKFSMIQFLNDNITGVDQISMFKGTYTFRRGFFYTHGMDADKFRDRIEKQLKGLDLKYKILDSGEIWKPFKGGAPLKNQSHWYVTATIEPKTDIKTGDMN